MIIFTYIDINVMAKIVKLKRSDLNELVKRVLEEQESLSDVKYDEIEPNDESYDDNLGFEEFEDPNGVELSIARDEYGNYYIMDKNGNIVAKTK